MGKTLFKNISFDLTGLISQIQLGQIGLPDLQRPFVWPNTKVRDLFDSMYRGYPVGYLLLWENGAVGHGKAIGADTKQVPAQMLIIDGQQRLTSLYAVFRGVPVVRQDFEREQIQIAFRPIDGTFEVTDAAIRKDSTWIPDISVLWTEDGNLFQLVDDYLERLGKVREVSAEERKNIQDALTRLNNLQSYPFTALALSAETNEEEVGEVFVRINSKGTPLNQADFILTLMSVFRDTQRTELEDFCRSARTPVKGAASAFNHFIEPDPDHLLRVAVGLAFRRARLEFVYSILRGKDLETGEFSDERRERQFEKLQAAQDYALDLQHWQDFFKCLMRAGFRSGKFISSRNTIIYSYVLYLIGRRDFGLKGSELRTAIARWFFFASLTGRYTGSPESAMEEDLANLRGTSGAAAFTGYIEKTIGSAFTTDYWAITLPNDLATSAARSPALFAYYSALNLLNARALFSELRVSELMDPIIQGTRANLERHHLFPRAYLQRNGYKSIRDTNQIANFALIEWEANADISDEAPAEYWQRFEGHVGKNAQYWHALPADWQNLGYPEFLDARRSLIAGVVRDGFEVLSINAPEPVVEPAQPAAVTPIERWLARLPVAERKYVDFLLEEPLRSTSEIAEELSAYLEDLEGHRRFEPVLDIETARAVAEHCRLLLAQAEASEDQELHRVAQASALYFILDDDSESDVLSETGFDDDLLVVRTAAEVVTGASKGRPPEV